MSPESLKDKKQHKIVHVTKFAASTLLRSVIFAIIFASIIVVSVGVYLTYQYSYQYNDKLLPGVIVNGIDLSGYTKNQVDQFVTTQNQQLQEATALTLQYPDGEVATFSASILKVAYQAEPIYKKAYLIGRPLTNLRGLLSAISQIILKQKTYLTVFPQYSLSEVENNLMQKYKETYTAPQDALFTIQNKKVVAFQIDKPGESLDTKSALVEAKQYFQQDPIKPRKPIVISVSTIIVQAKIPMEEANELGIVEEIGRGVSNFAHSGPPRVFNIKLVSSRINGTLVPKGEIFSFIASAGEISSKTGYQDGYAIISGQTVLSDGGGVCQESTTLFRAALNAGLPIVAWKNHSYRVRYYENDSKPGFDATVYAPRTDFKFKNDTPAHILVQSSISGTILTLTFYGKKDGRVATVSESRVWDVAPPPEVLYKDDPTIPKGQTKQVDFSAWGAKAAFDYKVVRNGEVLQERTFTSVYRPWQAVYLVGTM